MKLTAIFLTVILLMTGSLLVGGSFISAGKEEPVALGCNSLPEIPLMKENVDLPPPPPDSKQDPLPTIVELEPVKYGSGIIGSEGITIGCDLIPSPMMPNEEVKEEDDSDTLGCNLAIEAEYPGGNRAWYNFLNKNLKFPTDSIGNGISGTVMVQFIVNEDGNVTDVKAISGPEVLSTEAVRVIKKSGKWTPGRQVSSGRYIK